VSSSSFGSASTAHEKVDQARAAIQRWVAGLPYAVSGLSVVAVTATLFVTFASGFDWTDEGFYLNWIAFPWDFSASVTMFGFVYHPLYVLAHGDIVLLRRLNLIATVLLAAILAVLIDAPVRSAVAPAVRRWITASSCLPVAGLVLIFYKFLPPTPNYNSLNLQGLLISAIGIVLLQKSRWEGIGGYVLLASGLTLCFLAKPPTAAGVAVLVCAYFLLVRGTRNLPRKGIAVGVASLMACLLLAAFLIDGTPLAFARRLISGSEYLRLMYSGHSLSLVDHFVSRLDLVLSWKRAILHPALAVCGGALAWLSLRGRPIPLKIDGWISGVLIAGLLWSLLSLWGVAPPVKAFHRRAEDVALLAVPAGAFAVAGVRFALARASHEARDRLCFSALLLALPFAYAYGSGMPLLLQSANAAFFWCIGGLVLFQDRHLRICYVLIMQILVVLAVGAHLHQPYRQPEPIFAPKVAVTIPWQSGVEVGLTPDSARYALTLARIAQASGWRPRTPLLDLTGNYPGAQYFLSGKPVGAPWILGLFLGSEGYARKLLADVPCEELAHAWVLTGSNEETALSPRLLEAHGIDLSGALVEVGTLISPIEEDGFRYAQMLYKPARPPEQAVAACRDTRSHSQP
jgi:hypothetical protein